ncbi:MAG: TasA family protein, partial [Nocardioidaceae bacterium]
MSRIELLARRPKRTLAALALVLLAVGVAVGSGANFTATAANPNNAFTAGALSITNTPNTALFTLTNWKPGDTSTGIVDIENTGSISGTFTLSRTNLTDTP